MPTSKDKTLALNHRVARAYEGSRYIGQEWNRRREWLYLRRGCSETAHAVRSARLDNHARESVVAESTFCLRELHSARSASDTLAALKVFGPVFQSSTAPGDDLRSVALY